MDQEERHLEENVERLIRAGYSPAARPRVELRQKTHARLVGELRARAAELEFPLPVLGGLVGALLLMAGWFAVQLANEFIGTNRTALVVVELLLGANLLSIPIASFMIVRRRRYAK